MKKVKATFNIGINKYELVFYPETYTMVSLFKNGKEATVRDYHEIQYCRPENYKQIEIEKQLQLELEF